MSTVYRCKKCGKILNQQVGFSDYLNQWTCTECYSINNIYNDDTELADCLFISGDNDHVYEVVEVKEEKPNLKDKINTMNKKISMNTVKKQSKKISKNVKNMEKPKNRKDWLSLLIVLVVAVFIMGSLYCFIQLSRLKSIGISSDYISRYTYTEIVEKLEDQGFKNINVIEIDDLELEDLKDNCKVSEFVIDGVSEFTSTKKFSIDSKITIKYHTLKSVTMDISYDEALTYHYEDLVKYLEDKGFINIETTPLYDLVLGWFVKDGSIKSITINDEETFDKDTKYRLDANIEITYHTFKE